MDNWPIFTRLQVLRTGTLQQCPRRNAPIADHYLEHSGALLSCEMQGESMKLRTFAGMWKKYPERLYGNWC
jgi:hypothetical protein